MPRNRKAQPLRVINGGKSDVRRAYETYRGNVALDVNVITVLSPDDHAYAAEIAARVRKA